MIREVASWKGLMAWALLAASGCATLGPRPVGPEDIPALQQRAAREPGDGQVHLLLGAALAAADRCDEAVISTRRGRSLLPADPTGPLIIGQCLEEAGDYEEALNLYAQFLFEHGDVEVLVDADQVAGPVPALGGVEGRTHPQLADRALRHVDG